MYLVISVMYVSIDQKVRDHSSKPKSQQWQVIQGMLFMYVYTAFTCSICCDWEDLLASYMSDYSPAPWLK